MIRKVFLVKDILKNSESCAAGPMKLVTSNTFCSLLPPATKLGQGYIFTGVCHSVNRWVLSQHALQVVSQHALQRGGATPACIAGGIPACLAAGLQGGLLPGDGLLLWPSVMPFCFGGLLIEGSLLVWYSGGGAEGHHTRRS